MFHELLDNPHRLEPGHLQSEARKRFPTVVRQSHLEERIPGTDIPCFAGSRYFIIGVASYSPAELELLDKVDGDHSQWQSWSKIAVFDVMECKDQNDVRQFTPQCSTIQQTPVVTEWVDGKPVTVKSGLRTTLEFLKNEGILA